MTQSHLAHRVAALAAPLILIAASAGAENHVDKSAAAAVKARQAHMTLYAYNLGQLGAMAKEQTPYDAEAAGAAAANLAALAALSQQGYWAEGTGHGTFEGSDALPAIWTDRADFDARMKGLVDAAQALEGQAGTDLAGLQAGMGDVGKACGACHKLYRKSDD